jgi:hypothetical protein
MKGLFVRGILLFCAAFCCSRAAIPESMIPEKVDYGFEAKSSDPDAGSCVIRATLSSFTPEIVDFRAGVWAASNNGRPKMVAGFILDVGVWAYKNHKPVALNKTPISEAFFSSKTFNSRGRLYDVDFGDGGRGELTGDGSVGGLFMLAVNTGDYDLTFAAQGIDERTYHVAVPPAAYVLVQYQDCFDALVKRLN